MLFVVGVLALGYYVFVTADAQIYQAYQMRHFEHEVRQPALSFQADESSDTQTPVDISPLQTDRSSAATLAASGRAGSVLGRIEIKKTGLAVMMIEGIDNRSLRRGVGHIPYTALPGQPGNVVIAGHRDTFFRDLRKIAKNDEITLTTIDGSFRYAVDFSEIVEPNDMEVLDSSGDAILTLVTCYPFFYVGPAPKRLIVRAHLIP